MDGEVTSWIRRANFSHSVCYRVIPPSFDREVNSGLPLTSPSDLKSLTGISQQPLGLNLGSEIHRNPVTNKKRSVSPSPHMPLPDSFKEAKSDIKRFSTPRPRRMNPHKGIKPNLSHSGPIKTPERAKNKKEIRSSSLSFDSLGSRVSALEPYLIDTSKVSYGDKFAQGKYSQLYHGEYKGKAVALKITKAPDSSDGISLGARLETQFTKEATLLSRLRHPNVVKFMGVNSGNCIITEYLPQGSLRSYLNKLEQRSLPLQQLIKFGLDIARGMEYIHSKEIVHRDLKPENVLIDKDFTLKIADFGIACEEKYCDILEENTGTFRWMAPEILRRRPHGRKVDVYSFGLILWEMVAGALPYEDMNPYQVAFAVLHKNIRPVIPRECPAPMKELIEQCWSLQVDKRPEFWQIVKILQEFDKSLKCERRLNVMPNQICPELKKGTKYLIQIFGSAQAHESNNTLGSASPKPKFA